MGIVSDEYTSEYCQAAHEVVDHADQENNTKSKKVCSAIFNFVRRV